MIHMVSAAFALMVATTAMNPLFLLKTRVQLQGKHSTNYAYNGYVDCAKQVFQKEGIRGFYKASI